MGDVYVGLDPSLTGFGVAAVGAGVDTTWLLKPKKTGVDRLLEISYELADLFAELQSSNTISDVAVEDTIRASYASSVLGELAGVVKMTCLTTLKGRAQYPIKVPPSTLKKYATGRGNAKKIEVMLAVYKHFGKEFTDDNEADAYVLAKIAQGHGSTQYQRDVVDKLRTGAFRDAHAL
jgi:Holliday junction resolvasome RuvABC endonuclease subunit